MTSEDDRLLAQLKDMWKQADPPPEGLSDAMVAAVAAADLDDELELLVLVRDSADEPAAEVRGVRATRVLYFRAALGWTLDAEIKGDRVQGQLQDFQGSLDSIQVSVETRAGDRWSSGLDEVGFFGIRADLSGWIRFIVSQGDVHARSGWVELWGGAPAQA